MSEFDYDLYRLAVAIQQYAERVVIYPTDISQIAYCRSEAASALKVCREKKINWMPVSNVCKGKKNAGRVTVTVEITDATSYGFSYYEPTARRISEILDKMWKDFIHGEIFEAVEV